LRVYRTRLALYADAPDQDEVTYALVDLSIKQTDPPAAERMAAAAIEHYPDSPLHEGFRLLRAVALYAQKDYERAAKAAGEMAAGGSGVAKLLGAQILHAQGRLDEALRAYRELADAFPDARRTVRFLERSGISVPLLTVIRTDEEPAVEMQARGVSEVEIKLYEIDLRRLYVRAGGKVDLAGIEVAGFRAALEKTVRLARPASSARRRQVVPLEIEKPAAYYLTARAGSFSTTGLVLRSDYTIELQADGTAARSYVSDARANAAAPDVLVTFIARTSPPRIETLRTDLRGIAEVPGMNGPLSVVAQKGRMVALALLDQALTQAPAQEGAAQDALREELLKNRALLQDRDTFYKSNLQQRQRRIQIKK
jgi:tetratricopeptide (TPR) repeat protein